MMSRPLFLAALACLAGVPALPAPAFAQSVGSVGAANQQATGQAPGAAARNLSVGAGVVQRERIRTNAKGSAQIAFKDASALNIGRNADVTIDKFVYQPASGAGEMTTSMTRGALRFVGGTVSHGNGATIRTPVATVGVRGGIASLDFDQTGHLHVVHHHGIIYVTNGAGTVRLLRSGFEIVVTDFNSPPSPPRRVGAAYLADLMARLTSRPGQRGGVRVPPNESEASRYDIGIERLGGDTPNFDLPAARDDAVRGRTGTRPPLRPPYGYCSTPPYC
ncbi:MAG: FecR domain-containing protein [Rhodoblastus sp.]